MQDSGFPYLTAPIVSYELNEARFNELTPNSAAVFEIISKYSEGLFPTEHHL